jgi:hypothetical protein
MKITERYLTDYDRLTVITSFAMGVVIFFGYVTAFHKLQSMLYPQDVIYGHGNTAGKYLAFIPAIICCVFLGIFITQMTILKWHVFRKTAQTKHEYLLNHSMLLYFILLQMIVCIPMGTIGLFNYTYFMETKIVHRNVLSHDSSYSWQDIKSIDSRLFMQTKRSRGTIVLEYQFHTRDGVTIELKPDIDIFLHIYPRLYRVIINHPEISLNSTISVSEQMLLKHLSGHDADLANKMAMFVNPEPSVPE